jgi:hypothetical protein
MDIVLRGFPKSLLKTLVYCFIINYGNFLPHFSNSIIILQFLSIRVKGVKYTENNNNNNNNNYSILYFNVLTHQLQEPITESEQTIKISVR